MTRESLTQYYDLRKEMKFVQERIEGLKKSIKEIEDRISEIEEGEIVKDKVRG